MTARISRNAKGIRTMSRNTRINSSVTNERARQLRIGARMTGAERQAKWRAKQNELADDARTFRSNSIAYVIERRLGNRNVNDGLEQIAKALEILLKAINPDDFAEWKAKDFEGFNTSVLYRDPPPKPDARLLRFIEKWIKS
jgi:hypothetical protein